MENNIIRIYKKRKYNEYLIEKREQLANVGDEYSKLAEEYNTKLLELLKADNKEESYEYFKVQGTPVSKEAQEKIAEIEKAFKDKMDDRNRLVDEVMAQIELCETREEAIEVYKAYGILDTDGKIYDYRDNN